jgi:hypothetical protein
MDTYLNKTKRSQGSAPQPPKTTPVPPSQPMKASQVPAPQQARDIPRPKPAPTAAPTQEDIAKRAYEIYVKKGRPEGQSEQIWKQAERELTK